MKLNGFVMSRDRVIAEVKNGTVVSIDNRLIPLRLRSGDIEGWLSSRAIDSHRTNSRLLKKALRLTTADDAAVVLSVNAATITDSYWWKPNGSSLTYEDVRFKFNSFDKLALYGDPDSFNQLPSRTPELTNIGSFEKCWRLEEGEWWLYKHGTREELFSEMFICELGRAMGFSMAEYTLAGEYIKSRDFTSGASVNFEPAEGLVGDNDDYAVNFEAFNKLLPKCAREYLELIYMDALVFNMDRHTKNYGVLRDVLSGEVLGMAPNFDNNIALIARGYPKGVQRKNDRLISFFIELLHNNPEAASLFRPPEVTHEMIASCAEKVPLDVDRTIVIDFVWNGYMVISQKLTMIHEQTKTSEHTMEY